MGNCIGGEDARPSGTYFHDDAQIELKSEIYVPQYTSLFNTLRKDSDLVVLQPSAQSGQALLANTLSINYESATANQLKMLLNFKKVVFIGDYTAFKSTTIKTIKASTSVSRFYVIPEVFCRQFLAEYSIFSKQNWQKEQCTTSRMPIFVLDSKEFVNSSQSRLRLFIHSSSKKDAKLYALLGIRQGDIVNQAPEGTTEQTNLYYALALKKKSGVVMMLHPPKMSPTLILEIISKFVVERFKIPLLYAQFYLRRSLPSATVATAAVSDLSPVPTKKVSVAMGSVQKFRTLLQRLEEESNSEKTERAYNLLCTLVINIYSNPDNEESYRKVKRTNKQMNELLSRYKAGVKLLDELGFQEDGDNWVNKMQSKYLKIYKTDFDLAYKQFRAKTES